MQTNEYINKRNRFFELKKKGLTNKACAEILNVRPNTLSDWSKKYNPNDMQKKELLKKNLKIIEKRINQYDISVSELLKLIDKSIELQTELSK